MRPGRIYIRGVSIDSNTLCLAFCLRHSRVQALSRSLRACIIVEMHGLMCQNQNRNGSTSGAATDCRRSQADSVDTWRLAPCLHTLGEAGGDHLELVGVGSDFETKSKKG